MARIVGVDIPRNKKIVFLLLHSWNWNVYRSKIFVKKLKVDVDKRVQEPRKQISSIREIISKLEINVEGELRSFNAMNIKSSKMLVHTRA